jgi:hypothetical protein
MGHMHEIVASSAPKPIQLYRQGYKGSDPEYADALFS